MCFTTCYRGEELAIGREFAFATKFNQLGEVHRELRRLFAPLFKIPSNAIGPFTRQPTSPGKHSSGDRMLNEGASMYIQTHCCFKLEGHLHHSVVSCSVEQGSSLGSVTRQPTRRVTCWRKSAIFIFKSSVQAANPKN